MITVRMQLIPLHQPVIGMETACLAVSSPSGAIPVLLIALITALERTVTPGLATVYRAVSRATGVMFVISTVVKSVLRQNVTAITPPVGWVV